MANEKNLWVHAPAMFAPKSTLTHAPAMFAPKRHWFFVWFAPHLFFDPKKISR